MQHRRLGHTDLSIAPIVFGGNVFGWTVDKETSFALLDRFAAAIESADVTALSELLREDVALEMPPALAWFRGRPAVARCLAAQFLTAPGRLRLVPTMANGQVMFAVYQIAADGSYHAHAVIAPTIAAHGIARMVAFANPALFGSFGLPPVHGLPASGPAPA